MNDKKSIYLKVQVDTKTDKAFKKILEIKGLTIQKVLEDMVKSYIFDNLECIINDGPRK